MINNITITKHSEDKYLVSYIDANRGGKIEYYYDLKGLQHMGNHHYDRNMCKAIKEWLENEKLHDSNIAK